MLRRNMGTTLRVCVPRGELALLYASWRNAYVTELPELSSEGAYRNLILDERRLSRAELEGATFDACSFVSADLRYARLNGAIFRDCNLTATRLAGANLFGATFERCKLMGVDFHDGLTLTATSFTGCNVDYAVFRGVVLDKMMFRQCTFVEADFSLASLRQATFEECDLSRVDLTGTTFFHTDLRGSMLSGWNVKRDALEGIVVTPGQMRDLAEEIGILVLDI